MYTTEQVKKLMEIAYLVGYDLGWEDGEDMKFSHEKCNVEDLFEMAIEEIKQSTLYK